jgi:hypothetical protein
MTSLGLLASIVVAAALARGPGVAVTGLRSEALVAQGRRRGIATNAGWRVARASVDRPPRDEVHRS